MRYREPAICLRCIDYSETSQVVHMLTRGQGVVRLLAKGSKRPKSTSGGGIDLFAEGQCVYTHAGRESLGTLIEFAETTAHRELRRDLARLNPAMYMLELCGSLLAEGDPHPQVFKLLHNALARLGSPDASPQAVLAYFQYRLLRRVGLLPEFTACVSCGGKPGRTGVYFSSSAGGLLCRSCEAPAVEKYAVPPAALAALAALAAAEAGQRPVFPEKQARAVNSLLAYHIEYQLGHRLKTARRALEG